MASTGRMVSLVQQSRIRYVKPPLRRGFLNVGHIFQAIETILEHYTDIFVDESEVS
jgi:hypothetical protein